MSKKYTDGAQALIWSLIGACMLTVGAIAVLKLSVDGICKTCLCAQMNFNGISITHRQKKHI